MFADAVKPLAEKRSKEGFKTVISTQPVAKAIASLPHRNAMLLLIGDDEPGKEDQPWYIPAQRRKLYRWHAKQARQFASDAAWGDFDGDDVPDMPVGRIPARSLEQLRAVVKKIIAYETRPPSIDDLRLPVWAGAPGYNAVIDSLTTGMLVGAVRTNAPAWAEPWAISGDPKSGLCGWPPDQPGLFA
ncbi:unnamed protein product, partial [marine sediment metagenome]